MRTINRATLLGHVGRAPEITATGSGQFYARFTVATQERHREPDGSWTSKTEWHNIIAHARAAEQVRALIKAGTLLHLEGRMRTVSWQSKRCGDRHYRTEIVLSEFSVLAEPGTLPSPASEPGLFPESRAE